MALARAPLKPMMVTVFNAGMLRGCVKLDQPMLK
jgi:hypothetical protein